MTDDLRAGLAALLAELDDILGTPQPTPDTTEEEH